MDEERLKILTDDQKEALDQFFAQEEFRRVFYLTGGTALAAFYLQHRYSDDLDFFTNAADIDFLWPMLQKLESSGRFTVQKRTPQFIRVQWGSDLQIDFVQDVPFRSGVPVQFNQWMIDSLENIVLNKISAIQGRLDVKDYVDLYFLIKDRPDDLLDLLTKARQKDGSIDPFVWAKLIMDVETFRVLPRMITPVKLEELVHFYRTLREAILISLKP